MSQTKHPFTHLFLILFIAWWSGNLYMPTLTAQENHNFSTERFTEANRLYQEGQYAQALSIYLDLDQKGTHWKLYYNIGNCYYKLEQPVSAKIYYLRAQRLAPFEPLIQDNLDITNKHPLLNDKTPNPQPDFISRLMLRIESILSLNVLSILLLLMVIVFNGFIFLLIKKGKRRWLIYAVSFSLVILLTIGIYHIYRVNKHERYDIAVIVAPDSQLRSGPGENNTVLFKVNPGLQVKIIEESRDWVQVSASSNIAGWIQSSNLERIKKNPIQPKRQP